MDIGNRNRCLRHCLFSRFHERQDQQCRKPRLSQSLLAIALLVIISFSANTTSFSSEIPLNSEQRAKFLMAASEVAEHVVIATILDTTFVIPDNQFIWTRYTARVDQLLKGDPLPDSTVTFVRLGGKKSTRVQAWSDAYPYEIGEQYLLFLAFCQSQNERRVVCSACTARISDGVAHTHNPGAEVPVDSVIDSIRTFLQPCSLHNQVASSDVIVTGTLVNVTHNSTRVLPVYTGSSLDVLVDQVLLQRGGPTVSSQVPIEITARRTTGRQPEVNGTKPTLIPESTYLLFIEHTPNGWALRNSAYAAWRQEGSVGYVEAWSAPCIHKVRSEDWNDLIMAVAQ